jgi:hypothetical protein
MTECSDCAEIKTITRMDTTLQAHTKELSDIKLDVRSIRDQLSKAMPYSNNFFGGMVAASVFMGMLIIQVSQPLIKPIMKLVLVAFPK